METIRALEYKKWLNDILKRGILTYEDLTTDTDIRKSFIGFIHCRIGQIWLKNDQHGIAYRKWQEN